MTSRPNLVTLLKRQGHRLRPRRISRARVNVRRAMNTTDEALTPWHVRRPDRLRWELASFADAGLRVRRIPRADHELELAASVQLSDEQEIPLRVLFPFEYPIKP